MSSRKNVLIPYQIIDAGDMAGNITSDITYIQFMDNIAVQFNWNGNPTGTFVIEGSLDHKQQDHDNATVAGNWISISLNPAPVASGASGNILIDMNQLSFPYIRARYVTTFIENGEIVTVADSAGSLNSKYFLLSTSDGTDYYVWFNINSAGVDPAVPGMTGVPVAGATNASANTLATALGAALDALLTLDNVIVSTNHVTFDQAAVGHGSLADSIPAPTGFTFTYDGVEASLDAFIAGKMV